MTQRRQTTSAAIQSDTESAEMQKRNLSIFQDQVVRLVGSDEKLQVQSDCRITAEYHVELCDAVLQLLVGVSLRIRIDIQDDTYSTQKAANIRDDLQ